MAAGAGSAATSDKETDERVGRLGGCKNPHVRTAADAAASEPRSASLRLVHMPERSTGSDAVPDQSFDLLDFGKAPLVLARPDHLAVQANLEDAAGDIRGQRHRAEFLRKCRQQLLGHPARPQAPAAESAVRDLY